MEPQDYKEFLGNIRPFIHTNCGDHKFVAVGNAVYFAKSSSTFPDFLQRYIQDVLRGDGSWGIAELKKPLKEQHPIIQWSHHHSAYQRQFLHKQGEVVSVPIIGFQSALLTTAYDLYVLRHHSSLQTEVIRRLKINDQFQGARYELFVAATFLRAGFDIRFEDERDGATKHPEFVAKHRTTGLEIDVEAKSRHRFGVLGYSGQESKQNKGIGVDKLLNSASKKFRNKPFAIFLDLNLPPTKSEKEQATRMFQMQSLFQNARPLLSGTNKIMNILAFTNFPFHYVGNEINGKRSVPSSRK